MLDLLFHKITPYWPLTFTLEVTWSTIFPFIIIGQSMIPFFKLFNWLGKFMWRVTRSLFSLENWTSSENSSNAPSGMWILVKSNSCRLKKTNSPSLLYLMRGLMTLNLLWTLNRLTLNILLSLNKNTFGWNRVPKLIGLLIRWMTWNFSIPLWKKEIIPTLSDLFTIIILCLQLKKTLQHASVIITRHYLTTPIPILPFVLTFP